VTAFVAAVAVLLLLAPISWKQTKLWKNEATLWAHIAQLHPHYAKRLFNEAVRRAARGDFEKAKFYYERSLKLNPRGLI
jgi:tetratricopeptide (TPR) repeat protein